MFNLVNDKLYAPGWRQPQPVCWLDQWSKRNIMFSPVRLRQYRSTLKRCLLQSEPGQYNAAQGPPSFPFPQVTRTLTHLVNLCHQATCTHSMHYTGYTPSLFRLSAGGPVTCHCPGETERERTIVKDKGNWFIDHSVLTALSAHIGHIMPPRKLIL